jgi:hypothetical protein
MFCPDGYVSVQEAIARAALCWFPEQIAALETASAGKSAINNKPNNSLNAPTPVEELARAIREPPSISAGVRQQVEDLLTLTEHRLRNFLHQGALAAYYFGRLLDQGRHAVGREFWPTTKADGVLMSGTYWPFGIPRTRHEQRPSYPLFFIESELAALLRSPIADVTNVARVDSKLQQRYLRQAIRRRGPTAGEIDRYAVSDRALFPEMNRLMDDSHKTVHAAALELARAGKIEGVGTPESRAKRLAKRFRKQRPPAATAETS